jgi:hypothetical protein
VNDAPIFDTNLTNLNINEDNGTIKFSIHASDIEGEDLNITVESNNTSIVTVSPSWNGLVNQATYSNLDFNITTVVNANGIAQIKITVNDGDKNTTRSFDINVTAVNDVPILIIPKQEGGVDVNTTTTTGGRVDINVTKSGVTTTIGSNGTVTIKGNLTS